MGQNLLSFKEVSKAFPGTQALKNVSFSIEQGEIHALVGENGAGKSTLVKIVSGALEKDSGKIFFNDNEANFNSPQQAQKAGIKVVYQELSLCPNLSVAENIFISNYNMNSFKLMNINKLPEESQIILEKFGINKKSLVRHLGIASQQVVEIAGSLSYNCKLLILDEPTASLTDSEIKTLFDILNRLRRKGLTILYISHKLDEIFEISDRITVLKDGNYVGTVISGKSNEDEIIKMMVGRELHKSFPDGARDESEELNCIFRVENLYGNKFEDVSFKLHTGEILGFAGLAGAGRTELFQSIFGVENLNSGKIIVEEREVKINSVRDAINYGIGYLPEDRKQAGLFMDMSLRDNIIAASLEKNSGTFLMNYNIANKNTLQMKNDLNIKAGSITNSILSLSGGNQQKSLLARWLMVRPKILIVDEPTRGIDVGAKQEVRYLLRDLTDKGVGIILISSELPEILSNSDRIVTMYKGKVTAIINKNEATEEKIASFIMSRELERAAKKK